MLGPLSLRSGGFPRFGTVMNVINAPLNLIKSFNFSSVPPAQSNANGYPTSQLSSDVSSQGSVPGRYYGSYVWSWNGAAAMKCNGMPAIVYASANCTIPGLTNNCVGNNFTIANTNPGVNPRVVLRYGLLVTGVSGGSGSPVVLTLALGNFAFVAGTVKIQNGASSNLTNGPNSDGSWTISAGGGGGSTVTLANSTGVTSPAITATGGPGVQTEAILDNSGAALYILGGNTISGFANLVYCQSANETAVQGGQLVDPAYVAQLQALEPAWLRFMDLSTVQGSLETDFAARMPAANITWTASISTSYWVGTIHNSGSDIYTCSAPALTNSGAYHNGELVQGAIDITNTGGTPTLNVNSRGAKKIIQHVGPPGAIGPFQLNFPNAAASAGQSMQYTFAAPWFHSGTPYVFTYTTTTTGHFGDDTASAATLAANVSFAMNQDATLIGNFATSNSGGVVVYCKTPQAGTPTISYSGPVTSTVVTVQPSFLTVSGNYTFMYSYVHDAFIVRSGGIGFAMPLEYMVQLCNQVGASMWYNWPINTSSAYVTAFTNFVADGTTGLASGLRFGTELGNEMWNFGATPWGSAYSYGWSLGLGLATQYQNGGSYSWTGLKTKQYYTASSAAWAGKGRASSQHFALMMSAEWDVVNTNTWAWQGSGLDASGNATYGTYGGVDGVAGSTNVAASYNASPNRPGDITGAFGIAPYWNSDFLAGDTGGPGFTTNTLTGTVAQNAPLFSAALQYQQGNTSGAYTALYNQFYSAVPLGGPAGGLNLLKDYKNSVYQQLETICRSFDAGRSKPIAVFHYEAGPQFGLGNINNGTNSPTTDIPAVQTHIQNNITNNSWDISAYTNSGTNNANELATSLCGMVYNFKFSSQFYSLYKAYMLDATYVHSGREACAAQYGYSANQWGVFPGSWTIGTASAYSSYQAIADFNVGV